MACTMANCGWSTSATPDVAATIRGVDDAGNTATDTVRLTIAGGQSRTLTPQDLETPGP